MKNETPERFEGYRPRAFTSRSFIVVTAILAVLIFAFAFLSYGCAGGQLSTREKGAGIGALGGAAVGGIIGATVGHPGAGAAIGGALGLGAGVLVGDQLQGRENQQYDVDRQLQEQQRQIEEQRREIERLRNQQNR